MTYFHLWEVHENIVPSATNFNRYDSFEEMVRQLENRKYDNNWLPNTTLFYFEDDVIIGAANIRHKLNEAMMNTGGHIGYGVAKPYRQKVTQRKYLLKHYNFVKH